MPKKPLRKTPKKKTPALAVLQKRVSALERDFRTLRSEMGSISEDVASLKVSVKHVDERTLRGEKLMLQMQGEQRKMAHTVDRIAEHLHVAPEVAQTKMVATVTEMLLDVGEEAGLTRDAEDTE